MYQIKNAYNFLYGIIQKYYNKANGIFLPVGNKLTLFLFNSKTYSQNTIRHELIHYFQYYFKYGKQKFTFKQSFDYDKFKHLNISEDELNYLFSYKEYIPHIDNCIFYLNKLENPDKFVHEFIDYLNVHKFDSDILQCPYVKTWLKTGIDLFNIKFFISCFIHRKKS